MSRINILLVVAISLSFATAFSRAPSDEGLKERLAHAVTSSVSSLPAPRPELSFVLATPKSIRIAVWWDQRPALEMKNEVRDRILWGAKKALAGEKRDVSVVFTDEIASPGWK